MGSKIDKLYYGNLHRACCGLRLVAKSQMVRLLDAAMTVCRQVQLDLRDGLPGLTLPSVLYGYTNLRWPSVLSSSAITAPIS